MHHHVRSRFVATLLHVLALGCPAPRSEPVDSGVDAAVDGSAAGDTGPDCATTDEPDQMGLDANCDGVDGVASDSVFVGGPAAHDANLGTAASPFATIGKGLSVAVATGKHAILIAQGTYAENITLVDGISLHGGYTSTWQRPPLVTGSMNTRLTAATSPVIVGEDILTPTRLTGFSIEAPDATVPGTSSVAMRLVDASALVVEDSLVQAGAGAIGVAGVTPSTVPTNGNVGGLGIASRCGAFSVAFGFECPVTTWTNGDLGDVTPPACGDGCGAGGQGAIFFLGTDFAGIGGTSFDAGGTCVESGSGPGSGGPKANAGGKPGVAGATGRAGSAGAAGALGSFTESGFVPAIAVAGTSGGTGGGGGGGSSGEGLPCNDPSNELRAMGGAGGDGGSGGCGGVGGGGAGGGGASVALYLVRSSPVLVRVGLLGGAGGAGGVGAPGHVGGTGGMGGNSDDVHISRCPSVYGGGGGAPGGDGGKGGDGGQGGTGGGGGGGPSAVVFFGADSSISVDSTNVYVELGGAGAGGSGGNTGPAGVACAVYRSSDSQCLAALP